MKRKKLFKIFLWLLSLSVLAELVLRVGVDVGEKPLYEENEYCEYHLQPNQDISRFHNLFRTNSYGMRSPELSATAKKRILLFGDSVLNGGSKIDQNDLLNTLLEQELEKEWGINIDVCNISAGSWGPENAFQFLTHKMDVEFDAIILVFSSHDYHDNMHFREVVGKEPAWPNQQPLTAIGDVVLNFLWPKLFSRNEYAYLDGFDDSQVNPGWKQFRELANQHQIPLLVYLHPEAEELKKNEWNENGKNLIQMLEADSVNFISGISIEKPTSYIDHIHMNSEGHKIMADTIKSSILHWFE